MKLFPCEVFIITSCLIGGLSHKNGNVLYLGAKNPVFHAYSAAIWVGISEMCNVSVLEKVFHDAPFVLKKPQDMQGPTPVGVAGSKDIHLGAIRYSNDSTRPGFWLWMSADTPVYDSGLVGVDMAKQILENSKSKRN